MIKILRPTRETPFISADVFEKLFNQHLGKLFDIQNVPLLPWCQSILGPESGPHSFQQAARQFYHLTGAFDYFCPGYELIPLAPVFLALRNSSGANVRLLFIAHAPGAFVLEWVLLKPLLVPGDRIIAPSHSAKEIIELFCPELSPFIRVLPHPIERLPVFAPETPKAQRLVTLCRISEEKLLHRQIEAMSLLQKQGHTDLRMEIAGSLNTDEEPSKGLSHYSRSLLAKIARLGLKNAVQLVGPILGEDRKAQFLAGAKMSVNLSMSLEESFGKALVEPLGLGIPVLASRWNGFCETVGNAGTLVPVAEVGPGILDVTAEEIAENIERMLFQPPSPEICLEQAQQFVPSVIGKQYRAVLEEALEFHPAQEISSDTWHEYGQVASNSSGLMGRVAILQNFSWKELMGFLMTFSTKLRHTWEGAERKELCEGEIIRNLLFHSVKTVIGYVYAGKDYRSLMNVSGDGSLIDAEHEGFVERIARAVQMRSFPSAKETCLLSVSVGQHKQLLEKSLNYLEKSEAKIIDTIYYEIELCFLQKDYSNAYQHFIQRWSPGDFGEHDLLHLRQLAKICRSWGKPDLALPYLRHWLKKYPDSPASGMVWLDYAVNASRTDNAGLSEGQEALRRAKNLLGESPLIRKLEQQFSRKICSNLWEVDAR